MPIDEKFLTPGEVAKILRVDPKTVTRWVNRGRFPKGAVYRTPGNHVRIREDALRAMLATSEFAD